MATRSELAPNVLKQIAKELQSLESRPPEDIQVIVNDHDLTEICALIRGPDGTPYENGYFKVRLLLTDGYPEMPPKGYFVTKIFHPNVAASGEICVNTLKKDWKPELGIQHVLLAVKCLLIVPNPESALNEEAGKLLLDHYDDYARRARLYTSIHAKSGKAEFHALAAERLPAKSSVSSLAVSTEAENPPKAAVGAISTGTALSNKTKEDDESTAVHVKTLNSNVLTTSAVSNSVAPLAGVKRTLPDTQDSKGGSSSSNGTAPKQLRVDPLPKSKVMPVVDKKKHLRRL